MIYTKWTKKAMKLAYAAHHGQMDKDGIPYIFHPIHLAEQMQDEDTAVAALLHDVIEDTGYTLEDLRAEGFSAAVLEALELLTHDEAVSYSYYIEKLSANRIAAAVKCADLRHNSDLSRLECTDDAALARAEKYARALAQLEQANSCGKTPCKRMVK